MSRQSIEISDSAAASPAEHGSVADAASTADKNGSSISAPSDSQEPVKPSTADNGSTDASDRVVLWLRRGDQLFLGTMLFALIVLLSILRWQSTAGGRTEIEITNQQPREYFYSLDINQASWVEWAQLDGIGEKLGRRIVLDREQNGPFRSMDDITRVRGIGPKLIEKLRPFLRFKAKDGNPDK
jgi:competence protein ComEA